MIPLTQRLTAFFVCAIVGWMLSLPFQNAGNQPPMIPAVPVPANTQIQEITMEVIYDWCGGKDCPDYKMIFQRQGREDYYSSVTRIGLQSHKIKHGDISKEEFDQLAQVIESEKFFELDPVYPKDGGCADCVITKVTVVRNGLRKKVVHLYDGMPLHLFIIQRTLEGMESQVQWLTH